MAATVAAVAFSLATGAPAAVRSKPACGFGGGDDRAFHLITYRKNVSCDDARRILRRIRGARTLIPMACHRNRSIRGWYLTNLGVEKEIVATRFSRGTVRIDYQRVSWRQVGCVDHGDQSFDEPDA